MRALWSWIGPALMVIGIALMLASLVGFAQGRTLDTLQKDQKPRTQSWAEAVAECESHGGVAVVRATKALGQSADLPACVPQLGD